VVVDVYKRDVIEIAKFQSQKFPEYRREGCPSCRAAKQNTWCFYAEGKALKFLLLPLTTPLQKYFLLVLAQAGAPATFKLMRAIIYPEGGDHELLTLLGIHARRVIFRH